MHPMVLLILHILVNCGIFYFYYRWVDKRARLDERKRIFNIGCRIYDDASQYEKKTRGNNFTEQIKRATARGKRMGIQQYYSEIEKL